MPPASQDAQRLKVCPRRSFSRHLRSQHRLDGRRCRLQLGRGLTGSDDVIPPPAGIYLPRWVCEDPQWRAVMSEITTVGLDLAKNVQKNAEKILTINLKKYGTGIRI
jgi:hypothetical protein